jgi:hypothetical protein
MSVSIFILWSSFEPGNDFIYALWTSLFPSKDYAVSLKKRKEKKRKTLP